LRLPEDLGVEILDLSAHGLRALSRALDVFGLLHASTDAADGGRGPPQRAHADRFSTEEGADERRPYRDHRLEPALRDLLLLAFDGRFRATQAFSELGLLRGVLAAHRVDRLVTSRSVRVGEADTEVTLALARV